MARPVQADAEATRKNILQAASNLFSELGSGKASMRAIARAAGVSQATVHHYFGSKDDLYAACMGAMYEELSALKHEIQFSDLITLHPQELLGKIVRTTYRFGCDHRPAVRLSLRNVIDTGMLGDDVRNKHLIPFLEEGTAILAAQSDATEAEIRLLLHSANYLIARYALANPIELAIITQHTQDPEGHTAALQCVEDHLVRTVQAMFSPIFSSL